ncbi:contractile injection system protein, VgrG/Pvc8 family [Variovorax boronicumulans]|uniref:contractile injection system protein, VgrG/Pvc8 family n=1 Tax=Variovorax boronicumulans TaxID=436515 RepID=UPI0012E61DB7|nr:contractile injection system protein, VgrG/Pvc8 family [Variovorax boronicumulans]GER17041.1 hypothetical protein VCH24_20540 [Variovorax boronicumulans]
MSAFSAAPARTLEIHSAAIPVFLGRPALEPVRLSGREGVNSLFEYGLLLKTPDALNLGASEAADFDLDSFIGREISCNIQLDGAGQFIAGAVGASVDHIGAGTRQINAVVSDAQVWGEEGRHVQYKLTLRPWLHLATLSIDCKIYQDKTVVQILDELLTTAGIARDMWHTVRRSQTLEAAICTSSQAQSPGCGWAMPMNRASGAWLM